MNTKKEVFNMKQVKSKGRLITLKVKVEKEVWTAFRVKLLQEGKTVKKAFEEFIEDKAK